MNKKKFYFVVCFLFVAISSFSKATEEISLPPATVEGFLSNGLRYIIKQNGLPRHNVECRLVINVGSVQEEEHQRGGAHFLEHMAFNGSTHFPGGSMVDYFERQGMKYGRDINAFTGFDRTLYWFSLPVDNASTGIIDTTLLVMEDILCNLTIDAERTKKERGVIIEELRGYDTGDDFYELKIGKDRYAQRMPLGRAEDINSITGKSLTEFYDRWYSPAVATVIIVGNVDVESTEGKIRSVFGKLSSKGVVKPTLYPLAYRQGVDIMYVSDSLQHKVKMDVMIPHPTVMTSRIEHYVKKMRRDMLVDMLDMRINRRNVSARVSDEWYLADKNHFAITMDGESGDSLLRQLTAVSDELKYLGKKGPGKEELRWALKKKLKRIRPETSDKLSGFWCDDFIDYAVLGDKRVYSTDEIELIKKRLRHTSRADIRNEAREILNSAGHTMLVGVMGNGDLHAVNEQTLLAAWQKGDEAMASHFVRPHDAETSYESKAKVHVPDILSERHRYDAAALVERYYYDEMSLEELKLSNGVTILLRPTSGNERNIHITALARGAVADVADSLYNCFKDAVGYVDMGGLETVGLDTLLEVMSDKHIMMNIGMSNHWHQIMGTSPTEDAQILMNLLYEKMHHPGKDREGFDACKEDEAKTYGKETILSKMMKRDQARVIDNLVDSLFGNTVPAQFLPYTEKDIDKLNLDDITDFYRTMFSDPSHLYFIITGCFNTDSIAEMAVSTFSRMKQPEHALVLHDKAFCLPHEGMKRKFPNSEPTQTVCNCVFAENYEPSLKNSLMFKLMRDILQNRLLSVLREKDNIVYSPFVDVQYHGVPQKVCMFRLYIDVRNDNFNKMLDELRTILDELGTHPVDKYELEKMKRSFIVTKRQALTDTAPAEWTRVLVDLVKNGETLTDYNAYDDVLNSITPEDVRDGFRKFFDYQKLILLYQCE